jgi:hypothetical protein
MLSYIIAPHRQLSNKELLTETSLDVMLSYNYTGIMPARSTNESLFLQRASDN